MWDGKKPESDAALYITKIQGSTFVKRERERERERERSCDGRKRREEEEEERQRARARERERENHLINREMRKVKLLQKITDTIGVNVRGKTSRG